MTRRDPTPEDRLVEQLCRQSDELLGKANHHAVGALLDQVKAGIRDHDDPRLRLLLSFVRSWSALTAGGWSYVYTTEHLIDPIPPPAPIAPQAATQADVP